MAEKIASGAWHETPAHPDGPGGLEGPGRGDAPAGGGDGKEAELERLRSRRDNARWSAVVGFGMLFAASFSTAFALGGVAMIVYGASASVYWSLRLRKLKGDPWAYDPELDGPGAPDWSRK